jgi:hypothetical protein
MVEDLPDDPEGLRGLISLAREHGSQPPCGLVPELAVLETGGTPELALDELPGRCFLVLVGELFQRNGSHVGVDALVGKFTPQGAFGELPALGPAADPHVCEVRIVHQPDFLEAVENSLGNVLGDVPLRQLAGELQPALGRSGQLTQHNRARDRCRIGVAVQLGRGA